MKSKSLFFALLLPFFLFTACQQSTGQVKDETEVIPVVDVNHEEPLAVTSIQFDATSYNFGEVPQDVPVKHRFTFTNTGKTDLLIENVKPSCNCTVAEYSKEPIKPGEKGYVEGEFNAKAVGIFKKTITVTANLDPKNVILDFSGEVIQ
jgi:hypothetical protein